MQCGMTKYDKLEDITRLLVKGTKINADLIVYLLIKQKQHSTYLCQHTISNEMA